MNIDVLILILVLCYISSAPGCLNRVVQGGVCVTHGAKRKLCGHPGCAKAVKLAGYCSTHGPARKKCGHNGCTRVAVQGGRCLSHGARRRVCCYPLNVGGKEKCAKNAIMGGMCKKHYDRVQDANGMLEMSMCVPVGGSEEGGCSSASSSRRASPNSSGLDESEGEYEQQQYSYRNGGCGGRSWGNNGAVAEQPVAMASAYAHHGQQIRAVSARRPKLGHQRGLSIFDEMTTVDAIISSGNQNRPPPPPPAYTQQAHQQQQQQQAATASMPTKTPRTQVSFADGTSNGTATPGKAPCLGNASCTCDTCRSPTLAIFEQMIQASHKIDKEEIDPEKYAALSPPKLSPRKGYNRSNSKESSSTTTPKNVSFLPDEPTSSGSVIRKVSTNDIKSWEKQDGGIPAHHQGHGAYQAAPSQPQAEEERQEGPASQALTALAKSAADSSGVGRTISNEDMYGENNAQYKRDSPPRQYAQQQQQYHAAPPPQYGRHYKEDVSQQQQAYQPPETPSLYDNTSAAAAAVVSSGSHQEQQQSLLPKRREIQAHLFIPKDV